VAKAGGVRYNDLTMEADSTLRKGSLLLFAAIACVACNWSAPDYWAAAGEAGSDLDGDGDGDGDNDTDADSDTDSDTDLDAGEDDAGSCDEDDTEGTCGGDADADADSDADAGTDGGVGWDGGVGNFPDFCGEPGYAIFLRQDGRVFDTAGKPFRGNAVDPLVVIHGFSPFYCGHCRNASGLFDELFSDPDYAQKTVYYFRHFYWYDDMEMTGWDGHKAGQAAHLQGSFWEMHDGIFGATTTPYAVELYGMAGDLGLDTDQYLADRDSQATEDYLLSDYHEGVDAGVTGTPTIFVNGFKVPSWPTLKDLLNCLYGYEREIETD